MFKRFCIAMLVALFGVGGLAAPAAAHTDLLGSDPKAGSTVEQPPRQVSLRFNESMDPSLATVSLTTPGTDPTRLTVSQGPDPTTLVADVPAAAASKGAWQVAYRVTSSDGHPVQGTLDFTVQATGADSAQAETSPGTAGTPENSAAPSADGHEDGDGAVSWVIPVVIVGGFFVLLATILLLARVNRPQPGPSVASDADTSDADTSETNEVTDEATDGDESDGARNHDGP